MNRQRDRRRRTLWQEFLDSFRAGPRAWYIVMIICLGLMAFRFFGLLALIFAVLFLLPALLGALLGRFVGSIREARILRRLQRVPR